MKKKVSISFIVLSTFLLLAFTVLPHHHHEGVACFIMERCEADNTVNDEHTNHHDASDCDHNPSCIAKAKYTASTTTDKIKCTVSSCDDHNHNHLRSFFIPFYFIVQDFIINYFELRPSRPEYRGYLSLYKSAETSRSNGLRAPPHMFS